VVVFDGELAQRIETDVAKAEQTNLLNRLFPHRHATRDECVFAGGSLADDRAQGDVVPTVTYAVDGAFTAPKASERLYVIHTGECSATHADGYGTSIVVVTESGGRSRIVARALLAGTTQLTNVLDLDGDGRDEILLANGGTNQGYTSVNGELVHVSTKGLETIRTFEHIFESDCGAAVGQDDNLPSERVLVLKAKVSAGHAPEIHSELLARACGS
jgi:hypothetical protein